MAAVAAVPGLGRRHRLPHRQVGQWIPGRAILASAGAPGIRDAGGSGAAGLLRSRREDAGRLPRWLPGVLGTLPPGRWQLLPRRPMPAPADLEPPVVRGLPVGLHGRAVGVAADRAVGAGARRRSEEQTSELQSLMRLSYAGFCLQI